MHGRLFRKASLLIEKYVVEECENLLIVLKLQVHLRDEDIVNASLLLKIWGAAQLIRVDRAKRECISIEYWRDDLP